MTGGRRIATFLTVLILVAMLMPEFLLTSSAQDYPPYAYPDAIPKKAVVGTEIQFDGSKSVTWDWKLIINYTWTFDEGSKTRHMYGLYPSYTFQKAGNYLVILNVTDEDQMSGSGTITIEISAEMPLNYPPVAVIGWRELDLAWLGMPYYLYGYGSYDDVGIINYTWSFVENGTEVNLYGPNREHAFRVLGNYTITLTVTDYYGLNGNDTMYLLVIDESSYPKAEAGTDQTIALGQVVRLNASGSTSMLPIINYTWNIMDPFPVAKYGVEVNYTFTSGGDHTVFLRVSDQFYNEDTDSLIVHVIRVNNPPIAEAGPNATILPGTVYTFDGSGSSDDSEGMTFLWNFRYNKTYEIMTGERPSFEFDIPGEYDVTLTVSDSDGAVDFDVVTITVARPSEPLRPALDYMTIILISGVISALALAAFAIFLLRNRKVED